MHEVSQIKEQFVNKYYLDSLYNLKIHPNKSMVLQMPFDNPESGKLLLEAFNKVAFIFDPEGDTTALPLIIVHNSEGEQIGAKKSFKNFKQPINFETDDAMVSLDLHREMKKIDLKLAHKLTETLVDFLLNNDDQFKELTKDLSPLEITKCKSEIVNYYLKYPLRFDVPSLTQKAAKKITTQYDALREQNKRREYEKNPINYDELLNAIKERYLIFKIKSPLSDGEESFLFQYSLYPNRRTIIAEAALEIENIYGSVIKPTPLSIEGDHCDLKHSIMMLFDCKRPLSKEERAKVFEIIVREILKNDELLNSTRLLENSEDVEKFIKDVVSEYEEDFQDRSRIFIKGFLKEKDNFTGPRVHHFHPTFFNRGGRIDPITSNELLKIMTEKYIVENLNTGSNPNELRNNNTCLRINFGNNFQKQDTFHYALENVVEIFPDLNISMTDSDGQEVTDFKKATDFTADFQSELSENELKEVFRIIVTEIINRDRRFPSGEHNEALVEEAVSHYMKIFQQGFHSNVNIDGLAGNPANKRRHSEDEESNKGNKQHKPNSNLPAHDGSRYY